MKKTFFYQNKLPKLPVPDLKKTIEKYLLTVQPLLTFEEWEKTKKICNDFIQKNGIGEKLYNLLLEKDKKTQHWLEGI
jgi:hypothetical protein